MPIADVPPVITEGPANITYYMLLGSDKTFNCKATGVPTPAITWFKDGVQVSDGERISVDANGALSFKGVTKEENGVYKCRAENLATTVENSATISVFCKTISNSPLVM